MNDKLLYVFDTNVIVSAFLFFHSKPAQALFKALKNGQLVLSTVIADELSEVLSRKKFGNGSRSTDTNSIPNNIHFSLNPTDSLIVTMAFDTQKRPQTKSDVIPPCPSGTNQ